MRRVLSAGKEASEVSARSRRPVQKWPSGLFVELSACLALAAIASLLAVCAAVVA